MYQTQDESDHMSDEYGGQSEKLGPELHVAVRHGFIKKVFSIVGLQLLLTSCIALPFQIYRTEMLRNAGALQGVSLLVLAVTIGVMCYMSCNPHVSRKFPLNYILLGIITCGQGVLVGMICMAYTVQSIIIAVFMTAFMVLGLAAFAMQTKYDFTGMGAYLFMACLALFMFGLIISFFNVPFMHTVYASCGALLFSFYIIFDTQMIVGGRNKKHEFSIDDYVFAALTLYLDIINLFIYLLELFGERRN